MVDSRRIMGQVLVVFFIAAILIAVAGLFVPFFSVLHLSFSIWRIHNACSVVHTMLRDGTTTMVMILPRLFGSIHHTCPIIAIAWLVLVGLGLLGVVAGAVVLAWKRGVA